MNNVNNTQSQQSVGTQPPIQQGVIVRPQVPQYAPRLMDPGKLYRREIKLALLKIILALGAYFFIQLIAMSIMQALVLFTSGFMGDAINMASGAGMDFGAELDMNAIMNDMQERAKSAIQEYTGMLTLLSAVIGLPIFLLIRGKRLFTTDIAERRAPLSAPTFIKFFIIAMGAQIVFNIGTSLLNFALEGTGQSTTDMLEQTMQMLNTPSGLIYICLVGPIVEELIFRGAIMKSLDRFGINFAIVISSLVFGLFHIFTVQAIFAFFMGLILGYIASRYSLKWSILAHILINSTATALGYLDMVKLGGSADGSESGALPLSVIVMLAFFVIGIIFLVQERWRFAELKAVGAPVRIESSPETTGSTLWKAAFTSIPLLIYTVVTVFAGLVIIIWGINLFSA